MIDFCLQLSDACLLALVAELDAIGWDRVVWLDDSLTGLRVRITYVHDEQPVHRSLLSWPCLRSDRAKRSHTLSITLPPVRPSSPLSFLADVAVAWAPQSFAFSASGVLPRCVAELPVEVPLLSAGSGGGGGAGGSGAGQPLLRRLAEDHEKVIESLQDFWAVCDDIDAHA